MPSASIKRNWRGLALPSCASGVTVPTSINPNPIAPKPSMASPFLSAPAANPIGFLNLIPITVFSCPCGQANSVLSSGFNGELPLNLSSFMVKSCACSGSNANKALRINEYIKNISDNLGRFCRRCIYSDGHRTRPYNLFYTFTA